MNTNQLPSYDPVKRNVEKDSGGEELSPMDPPGAYAPPKKESVPYEDLHPFLQKIMDDHREFEKEIDAFEKALHAIPEEGITKEIDTSLRHFFQFFDEQLNEHTQIEEKRLFTILQQRLLEKGEHSNGPEKTTAMDMFEDDHTKAVQLAAVIFNFLGLVARLPDPKSRLMVLDVALEQGNALVELLRLHIFREDHVMIPQAHQYINKEELNGME